MPNCKGPRQGRNKLGKTPVRCLVQPGDGIQPLVAAINRAKKSVEIVIFRMNRREIEHALADAVTRGVHVHALIAYTNRGGEANLRQLELRLLAAGVTVSRTDNDLVRYHGKLMIVDRRQLFLLAFNFTYLDIEQSRSFGIITDNRRHVLEAVKLFEADTQRHPYTPSSSTFVVSPINARRRLADFIQEAKRELLIYDPEVSDPAIIRLLEARCRAGVDVRLIGTLRGKSDVLTAKPMPQIRLHTRSIVRDGQWAFVGSQSLRALELDSRREVGIIFRDPKAVAKLRAVFQDDWASKAEQREVGKAAEPNPAPEKVAKKVAKAYARDLDPVTPMVEMTVKEITGDDFPVQLNPAEIEETVKNAVKEAVREAVHSFVEEAIESPAVAGHHG